ncbi:hypothetical protein [Bacillus subtilis]|uniref:hypothetical protein n=1 Tax=Bacillus subtilis TaxID=1423 RepID=UPI0021D845F2|nr:hypothetical protein [Bacillus subtilis]
MFYPISKKDYELFVDFKLPVIFWEGQYKISEEEIIKVLSTGFIKDACMVNGKVQFTYANDLSYYKVYISKIPDYIGDTIEIEYIPALDKTTIGSYEDYTAFMSTLRGNELPLLVKTLNEIRDIRRAIGLPDIQAYEGRGF